MQVPQIPYLLEATMSGVRLPIPPSFPCHSHLSTVRNVLSSRNTIFFFSKLMDIIVKTTLRQPFSPQTTFNFLEIELSH